MKKFHKIGKVIFIILFIYSVLLYPMMAFAFLTCSGSEFCGMWVFYVFPLHFIIYENLTLIPDGIVLPAIICVALFCLCLKLALKKFSKFDIGYSWSIILAFILSISLLFVGSHTTYQFKDSNWTAWSNEAISLNKPEICIDKVTAIFQDDCLENAAVITGDGAFCEALEDNNDYPSELLFMDCITAIQIVKNVSDKFCEGGYDLECAEIYSPDFRGSDMPAFELIDNFEKLAVNTGDASWCDLMSGTAESDNIMYWCYAETFAEPDNVSERLSYCDKIAINDYRSACYNFTYWEMFKATDDSSWCDQISDDYPFKEQCE